LEVVNNDDRFAYGSTLWVAALAFMVMPLLTTFNELLTKAVEHLQFVAFFQNLVAPFMVRVTVAILGVLGIPSAFYDSTLYLTSGWMPMSIYIGWNCIGWQSFVLLAFTLITGLHGSYTWRGRIFTLILGFEGTFLTNILRIVITCLTASKLGYVPALIIHDYLGTILTLSWLTVFWFFSFSRLLQKKKQL